MASEQQVKRYLAYWLQLGKKVVMHNGESAVRPQTVILGNRYSDEFEQFWQKILSSESGDCYLEGTDESIAELLTPVWSLEPCSRCEMPIPVKTVGMPPDACPCFDLPWWPNQELPAPREPIASQDRLSAIRDRLNQRNGYRKSQEDLPINPNSEIPVPRNAISSQGCLGELRDCINKTNSHWESSESLSSNSTTESPEPLF
ncbi:MAG: hypothetical protein AB1589_35380 [Cyanobacteriota bacterium]